VRSKLEKLELIRKVNSLQWWHTIDLGDGIVTPGTEPAPRSRDSYLNIPEDLTGKDVLDIGAWDGLYSFVAEERGARSVTAIDTWDGTGSSSHKGFRPNRAGFNLAREARGSAVMAHQMSVYEAGVFREIRDVVFFFGVLYHLEDPMRALRSIWSVLRTGGLLILESDTILEFNEPVMKFTETGHHGDETNVWYPNRACMEAMLRRCGFSAEYQGGSGTRAAWHAKKL
jgi:tRNA (mo5U34)-methyltransferase